MSKKKSFFWPVLDGEDDKMAEDGTLPPLTPSEGDVETIEPKAHETVGGVVEDDKGQTEASANYPQTADDLLVLSNVSQSYSQADNELHVLKGANLTVRAGKWLRSLPQVARVNQPCCI